MKRWDVYFPITGVAYVSVEAETQQEAIDAAIQSGEFTAESIHTFTVHRHYAQERGNMTAGDAGEG